MASFGQTDRLLNFTSPLGADVLLPERLTGAEGISELFDYQLELLAEKDATVDPKSLVGQKVCVGILADDSGTERYINGIVASFETTGGDDEFNSYRARIVPNLWVLTLNTNTRVFQNQTVVDVIQAVLSPYNISPSVQTSATYTPMEYCTQYRETDFDFISRLMEQHGIFYYFSHTKDDHTLTLQDVSVKLSDCAIQNTFRYAPEQNANEGFYDFVISDFLSRSTLVSGKHTTWDYSFIRNKNVLGDSATTSSPLGANSNEQYDYVDSAAAYLKKDGSDPTINDLNTFFMNVRRDASDAETLVVEGASNAIPMQTGYTFTLSEYPQSAVNTKYLLIHIEHDVQQVPSYRTGKQEPAPYANKFRAVPTSIKYRSPLKTQKPVVGGMHTGFVVVQQNEDSYMDKYGRVNVQFWWDRLRKPNTPDNTLLRVAQGWAGKGWGTYFWPRVGDEVLIDFIEGDPDQPIVVGSVYNGVNMPKYDPAGQYTLSGILTRSSTNGGAANANELRFEDLKGKEQVFMNAERDYDLHVEHDWHTMIGNQQHETITDDHYMQTGGDTHYHIKKKLYEQIDDEVHQTYGTKQVIKVGSDVSETIGANLAQKVGANTDIEVGANLAEKVGANMSLNVGVNEDHKIGMNYNIEAGMIINLKAGMQINIDAPLGLNLTCGGNFVNLTPAGVMIQGILVNINSGGAAMNAQAANPQAPKSPDSPTAPKDPTFPGDTPPSQAATGQSSGSTTTPALGTGSSSTSSSSPAAASSAPAAAAAGAAAGAANTTSNDAQQATQQAAQAAQQAANQATQSANQAQQAAQQTEQQARQAVNQTVQQARQSYQQANQAVQQAQQAVQQASAQGQAAAQQALNQAQQEATQTAQAASQAVQQAQQAAAQAQQQAQQTAAQAQQQAQQAQQAAGQAQQAANQAAQQGQQAAQQAQQQAQQAQQQAQQAANQAQQTAQQAQQQAAQAQQQVTQAASQAQQQAQQASQAAQNSAQQAMNSAARGF
ncbi:MAG TPA: type VI secretion system tip protein TssI/VgrG [Terracidiphilus sp.]|nr:type VI secretion system tip protein TssI/VgrG [Terracidiphilus sp.]